MLGYTITGNTSTLTAVEIFLKVIYRYISNSAENME